MDEDLVGCMAALFLITLVITAIVWAGIATLLALVYIGQTVLIAAEFVAHGFTLFGVSSPIIAWALLGGCLGCLIGFLRGLYKVGRKSDAPRVYGSAGALVGILALTSFATVSETRRISAESLAALVVEQASAGLRVTKVTACKGKYSTEDDSPRCNADPKGHNIGMYFEYTGAIPDKTQVLVKWFKNGELLRISDTLTLRTKSGWIYDNYFSPSLSKLPAGTYEAILYGLRTERGRGEVEVADEPLPRAALGSSEAAVTTQEPPSPPIGATPGQEGASPPARLPASEHVRRARDLVAAGEYKRALAEAEEALQSEPENEEARALRDQIQGIMQVLQR